MKAKLFREDAETREKDIYFSVVGSGHFRAYFTLIPIAGYSPVKRLGKHPYFAPPFTIYSMAGTSSAQQYKTEAAAKRAVRSLVKKFIINAPSALTWNAEDSGVHWTAKANGIQIASYYYCSEAKGHWHKDFTVYFGGTYYLTRFASIDEARAAVASSYDIWLAHARRCLIPNLESPLP